MSATDGRRARLSSRRSLASPEQTKGSRKTVLIALASNAAIAIIKAIGGLMSGSTALLAEAAHSIADTTNQAFLLVSLSLAQREPSRSQPFGYGQARYLWTFMAATGMFLAGAVFALGYGAYELIKGPSESGGFAIAWVVLALGAVFEGLSWARALQQTRGEAREAGKSLWHYVRESRDPNTKMVLFEDSAALVGVAIAATGIGIDQLTGSSVFDPIASVLIGVLLVGVAVWMARDTSHLLIGASATPDEISRIENILGQQEGVTEIVELLTMVLGPNALLVAARVDVDDDLTGGRVEELGDEIEDKLREAVPDVREVFLDATPARR